MNLIAWKEQGIVIAQQHNTGKWALADWLAAGDTACGGAAYITAQELFPHLSRKYLMNIAYVARHVTLPFRKEKLSFAHHEQVAALEPPEQEKALTEAVSRNMTVGELKKYLRDVVLKESPFSVPFEKGLFAQLEQFARTVKVSPEALVNRAVQLFLANPPQDLAETYRKEIEDDREKRRLYEESRLEREANQIRRREEWDAAEKDWELFIAREIEPPVHQVGDFLRRAHAEEFRKFAQLVKTKPHPDRALVRERLTKLLALATSCSVAFPDDEPGFATAVVQEGDARKTQCV